MKRIIACFILLIMGVSNTSGQVTLHEVPDVVQMVYTCERGAMISVTYINMDDGDSLAVALVEGRQIAMTLAPSRSGVRYVAINDQESYRWQSKDNEGVLSFRKRSHGAKERPLLRQCRAQKP